jgi:hypothetical protein
MSKRDALRAATVGAKKQFRTKIEVINGEEFEVRQLSVKDRMDVYNKATKNGVLDPLQFQIWAVISTVYVPGTNEKLYDETDYEGLVTQPTGGFLDQLSEAAVAMLNPEEKPTKDSVETQTE